MILKKNTRRRATADIAREPGKWHDRLGEWRKFVMTLSGFLLVFLGSGMGGVFRHGLNILSTAVLGPQFPYGTLTINIAGSLLMGVVMGLLPAPALGTAELRLFLTTGLLGGFTTFSAFSADAVNLWERHQYLAAVSYIFITVAVSIAALGIMLALTRR